MIKTMQGYLKEINRAADILDKLEKTDIGNIINGRYGDIKIHLEFSLVLQSCIEIIDYIDHIKKVHSLFCGAVVTINDQTKDQEDILS